MRKVFLAASTTLLFMGCAHHVYTSKFDTNNWKPTGERVEGVVNYEPAYVEITHTFTERTDERGNVTDNCSRTVQKQEIVLMANLEQPRVVLSNPGMLASGQLSVTLTNGMLGGLLATSESQLSTFLGSAGTVMAAAALQDKTGKACNASPKISSFKLRDLDHSSP